MQILLATPWFPSLNPMGTPSIVAFCAGLSGMVVTENWRELRPKLIVPVLTLVVPIVLFSLTATTRAPLGALQLLFDLKYRTFPNADDYCANYIYLAFALVISVRIWRFPSVPFRFLGATLSAGLAAALIIEFAGFYI